MSRACRAPAACSLTAAASRRATRRAWRGCARRATRSSARRSWTRPHSARSATTRGSAAATTRTATAIRAAARAPGQPRRSRRASPMPRLAPTRSAPCAFPPRTAAWSVFCRAGGSSTARASCRSCRSSTASASSPQPSLRRRASHPHGCARARAAQRARVANRVPENLGALRRAALLLVEVEAARIHAALLDDPRSKISPPLRAALNFGRAATADRIEKAKRASPKHSAGSKVPTCSYCRPRRDRRSPSTRPFLNRRPISRCSPASPASRRSAFRGKAVDGLPVGVQVLGPDDALVLGVAAELA